MKNKKTENWQAQLSEGVVSAAGLKVLFEKRNIKKPRKFYEDIEKVGNVFPVRISPHVLKLCLSSKAVYRQFIPDGKELIIAGKTDRDPFNEDLMMPVENLIHMYRDRALLLVTDMCFSFCRFCTRKRLKRKYAKISSANLNKACQYIASHKQIKDVIISGGDPLSLSDADLKQILEKIKKIKSVRIIRIGTRAPFSCPERITDRFIEMLKGFHPIYVNVHFNHPDEFTPESVKALKKMSSAGIILGNQSVLLKGINDSEGTMKELFYKCLVSGVRPYCLFQCDEVSGTEHFWTDYQKIFKIAGGLMGNISGLAVPNFVFDCKGGVGKIRIAPDSIVHADKNSITFRNFKNKKHTHENR
jgi:lysine 2,3-aminomutase